MQGIFAIALASMQHDMNRLDRIALNLANVATPGYKREVVATQSFSQAIHAAELAQAAEVNVGAQTHEVPEVQMSSDMRPGAIKLTSEPLDVAILGDGFFEVNTGSGPAYTRQGNFHMDAQGRLVTAQGHPVMGKAGDIYLTTQHPVIDAAGNITEPDKVSSLGMNAAGSPVAQLKIVRFENVRTMRRLGDGLLHAGAGMLQDANMQTQVRQGALENANVNPMQEMVQLIQTMRHFESMQKLTQGYDEMLGTAIHKLGDLS